MRMLLLSLCLALAACGRDPAAPAHEDPLTPLDTTLLRTTFTTVALIDRVTGAPGLPDSVKGLRFSRKAQLRLVVQALHAGMAAWTVQSRSSGEVQWQAAAAFAVGENIIEIGQLPGDIYLLAGSVAGVRAVEIRFAAE